MSTPVRKVTDEQALAWIKANPDATPEEIRAYISGVPSPERFGTKGLLGKAVAAGRGALQGVTMEFGDEILGTVGAMLNPATAPSALPTMIGQGIRDERAINQEVRANNPKTFIGGQIAGGIGSAVAAAPLAMTKGGALAALMGRGAAGNLAARSATGIATGAGLGAITGAGGAEGNPLQRLDDAAIAAAFGGAVGGALPIAGGAGRLIGDVLHVREPIKQGVAALGSKLRGGTLEEGVAAEAGRESASRVNTALKLDRTSPGAIADKAVKTPSVPQPAVTLGGDNTKALAIQAQARSNTAREFAEESLEQRAEGETTRHIQRLGETLNPEDNDVKGTLIDLFKTRKANAKKNYEGVLDQPVEDVDVAKFMRIPEVKRAYTAYRDNQILMEAKEVPPDIYTIGAGIDGKKTVKLTSMQVPLRAFDKVQAALQKRIATGKIDPDRGDALLTRLNKVQARLEKKLPAYGSARQAYRDDSSPIDALKAGRGIAIKKGETHGRSIPDIAKASDEDLRDWLANTRARADGGDPVAGADLEHYMLGAFGYFRNALKSVKDSSGKLALPKLHERIRLVMGDEKAADEFFNALRAEVRSGVRSRGVSQAGRSIQTDEQTTTMPLLDVFLTGNAALKGKGAVISIMRLLRGEHTMSERTANATMQRLFSGVKNMDDLLAEMESLSAARKEEVARKALGAARNAGTAAGVTGAVRN